MHLTRRSLLGTLAGAAVLRAQPKPDPTLARIQADLVRHASFGSKRSATPGDLATAEWIAQRLKTAGYKVQSLDFESPHLAERTVRLTTGGMSAGMNGDMFGQTPAAVTGPKGVTGKLALVRTQADTANTKGKIAFVVLNSARHAALGRGNGGIGGMINGAAAAGALGVVIVTTGPSGEAILLNAPEDKAMPVPVAILAPKKSKAFEEAARDGAEATFILDGDASHRTSKNVVARLERGPKWIGISTPRSGWFDCVGERGSGTSVFLELCDWVVDRFPQHSIHVMNSGAHEYYFAGSHKIMHLAPPPAMTDIWAHIGATVAARDADESGAKLKLLDTADPSRSLMATPNLNAVIAEAFKGITELATARPVRAEAGELSVFTDKGYQKCFAILGLHRWLHTTADTIDKVDARLIVPVLEGHKRTIELAIAG